VLRIQAMTHELLEELRATQLDEPTRAHLAELYDSAVRDVSDSLSIGMKEELLRLFAPFGDQEAPSLQELRVADAQLAGWLDGLVRGLEAGIVLRALASQGMLDQGAEPSRTRDEGAGPYL
jgi:proteasome activator-like protein